MSDQASLGDAGFAGSSRPAASVIGPGATSLLDGIVRRVLAAGLHLRSAGADVDALDGLSRAVVELDEIVGSIRAGVLGDREAVVARTHRAGGVDADVPVGLVWFDSTGMVVETNLEWTTLTGLDRSSSLGDGWLEAFAPGRRALPSDTITSTLLDKGSTVVDWPLADDDGGRWITASIRATPDGLTMAVLDLTERMARERDLARRANHDRLTGLANRDLLVDRVTHALSRLDRHAEHCALLFVDLDGFKAINDRFGHMVGDEALAAIAERVREVVRPDDTVARVGGDEFVVLCEDLDSEAEAFAIGRRILAAILDTADPPRAFGVITASIGIAFATGSGDGVQNLIDRADRAMYRAKGLGGDDVQGESGRTTRAVTAAASHISAAQQASLIDHLDAALRLLAALEAAPTNGDADAGWWTADQVTRSLLRARVQLSEARTTERIGAQPCSGAAPEDRHLARSTLDPSRSP